MDDFVPVGLGSEFVLAGNSGDAVKDVIQPGVVLEKLVSSWENNSKLGSAQATHGKKEVLALFEPKMRISLEKDSAQVSGSELGSMQAIRDSEFVPDKAQVARSSKLKQNSKQTLNITKVTLQEDSWQVAPEVVAINAQATQENELVLDSAQALQTSKLKEGSKHVSNKVQNTCVKDNVQSIFIGSMQISLGSKTGLDQRSYEKEEEAIHSDVILEKSMCSRKEDSKQNAAQAIRGSKDRQELFEPQMRISLERKVGSNHCSCDEVEEVVQTDLVSDKFPELWEDDAKLDKVQALSERNEEGLLKLFELEGQQIFSTIKSSSSTPDSRKQEVLQPGTVRGKFSCSWEEKAKVDSKQENVCDEQQQISSQGFELEVQQNFPTWTVSFATMDSSKHKSSVTRASHEIGGGECHDPRVCDPMTWARRRLFPQRVSSMLLKPSAAAEGVIQDLKVTRASHGMGVRECHDPRDRDQVIRAELHVNKRLYHTSHPGMHYSHVIHPVRQFSLGHRHKTWARWYYGWKVPWSDHLDQQVVHEPCCTYILNKQEWVTRCCANYWYVGLKMEMACSLPCNHGVDSNLAICYIKEYNKGWWQTRQKEEMAKQRGSGAALLICTAMVGGVFHYGKEYCKHMEYGSMRWQGTLLASVGIKERKNLKID